MNLAKLEAELFLAEPVEYEKELRGAGTRRGRPVAELTGLLGASRGV